MNSEIEITSADAVDLDRHGIIEAHAGTGKTYTIVNLVLRALERPADGRYVHLREILLVTYTEKAAGELKKRIQEGIVRRLKEITETRLASHLEDCLNKMHEALIGTIHSVCLRLLQTWPFETRVHFNIRIADDKEDALPLMRESMRTDWQDKSTGIPQTLKVLEERGVALENKKHLKLIQLSALEFLKGDYIEIDEAADGGASLEQLTEEASDASDEVFSTLRTPLIYALIRRAAEALAARYSAHKRRHGLVSYDDMLQLTRDAIYAKNGVMLKTLREKLRYGIIDEFQDTSPVQWDIFKKIFLDNDDARPPSTMPKIYIVGDPKQSIYAFQNADVRSYIAAKEAVKRGGAVYILRPNYRSLPEMINGYNAILGCNSGVGEKDWFLFDDGGEVKITYPDHRHASAPAREKKPRPLPYNAKAVQVIATEAGGKAGEKRAAASDAVCCAIKKLVGKTISIPKGHDYEDKTLDYNDFAVIVESHIMAAPFIEAFRAAGIPYMKYKLWGVFRSPIARDLRAVLTAVNKRRSRSHRAAALLTHFFNRPPETIDPVTDLNYCADDFCKGDNLCAAHALDAWGELADRQQWAQLFADILERTAIRQQLIHLHDGERKLADLRQIIDYCVEYLYHQNASLKHLIDELETLHDEERAKQDKNIHVLSTEKASVSILTMHASKGLEFPVAFIMNRTDIRLPSGPNILTWTDDASGRRVFTPYISASKEGSRLDRAKGEYKLNIQRRERRRLLYVAITRPQAMLFLPLDEKDKDLAPRLNRLLENKDPSIELFDASKFGGGFDTASNEPSVKENAETLSFEEYPKLSLREFITKETSYSQLSKIAAANRYADDYEGEARDDEHHAADRPQMLRGGRHTGNALHGAIEEILKEEDVTAIMNNDGTISDIVNTHLKSNGVLDGLSADEQDAAAKQAVSFVKNALSVPYPIDEHGNHHIVIGDLKKTDRVPEMEFLLSCKPHRIRGFIDLVFRVRNDEHPAHPYRYYAADWKSDTLTAYDRESVKRHCVDKNYLLQSKIYLLALDKYLRGLLRENYDRSKNLGGALYVFMRGGNSYWYRNADPINDDNDVRKYVER